MEAREWVAAFAESLGVDAPDEQMITELLDLAAVAAHGSERIAAPLACWLVGRAGVSVAEARARADTIAP